MADSPNTLVNAFESALAFVQLPAIAICALTMFLVLLYQRFGSDRRDHERSGSVE